jgi:hypothetical protein
LTAILESYILDLKAQNHKKISVENMLALTLPVLLAIINTCKLKVWQQTDINDAVSDNFFKGSTPA